MSIRQKFQRALESLVGAPRVQLSQRISQKKRSLRSRAIRLEFLEDRRLLAVSCCDDTVHTSGDLGSVEVGVGEGGPGSGGEGEGGTSYDFGDAPDPPFPTLYDGGGGGYGAYHAIVPGFHLGGSVDGEPDGQPDDGATGDDLDGHDDDDGVVFTTPLIRGTSASIEVTASQAGFLDAWLDMNGDGDWTDAGERIFTDELLNTGVNALTFGVPSDAVETDGTFARFRFSSGGGLSFDGPANDGEVEDYSVPIYRPPTVTLSVSPEQFAEDEGQTSFIATLEYPTLVDVTVDLGFSGTATTPADYTRSSTRIVIPAHSTSSSVVVTAVSDNLYEGNETVVADIVSVTNATELDEQQATGTILDDDPAPRLSIGEVTVSESEATATFTVTLSEVSGLDAGFEFSTAEDTATADEDYTPVAGSATIATGDLSTTIVVPILQDSLDEDDETFEMNLWNPSHATIEDGEADGTILDDDPMPALWIRDASVSEDGGLATFTISLDRVSGRDVTVHYATADDSAEGGLDYTVRSGTVTFAAGSKSTTVTVPILQDDFYEGDQTFWVNLTAPTNATILDDQGKGVIVDDDPAPQLSIDDVTADEASGTVTYTVSLSSASTQSVEFDYVTSNETAKSGEDYEETFGRGTIPPGTTWTTIDVTILQDSLDEPDEVFWMNLLNPVNAAIEDDAGKCTIVDDDEAPTLSINDVSLDEAMSTATFTVYLSEVSGRTITLDYAAASGTATAGADFTAATGTETIPAGASSVTIKVPILQDDLDEADEDFFVNLSMPANAVIDDGQGVGTIIDDDLPPALSIGDVLVSESAGVATFTVSLSAESGRDVEFEFASADDTATADVDYGARSGRMTIPAGQTEATIAVPIAQDAIREPQESFTVSLSGPVGATLGEAEGTGMILDDDPVPLVTLQSDTASIAENGGTATITAVLSNPTTETVTVNLQFGGTATLADDYTRSGTQIVIQPGSTSGSTTLTAVQDPLVESNETVETQIAAVAGALEANEQQATVVIVDDDGVLPIINVEATAAPDVIVFGAGDPHVITINGSPYYYDPNAIGGITIDGLGGNDSITINGTSQDETATLSQGGVTITGETYTISIANVEIVTVRGGGGDDQVTLVGPGQSNRLYSYPDYTLLTDSRSGYRYHAEDFETVDVRVPEGGRDFAYFHGTPDDDSFEASPDTATMDRPAGATDVNAAGFERTYVYGYEGADEAVLTGSETATNRFYGYADYSLLTDTRRAFYLYAEGIDTVTANAPAGGTSYAYLYDSEDTDLLTASPESATMDRAASWTDATTNGFQRVYATSTNGGDDTAELTGSDAGGNRYFGYSTHSTFSDSARTFYHSVRGFKSVTAIGSGDSSDRAFLYDSSAADRLFGRESRAYVQDAAGTTYHNEVVYFDLIFARSSDSSQTNDTVDVDDSLAYNLIRSGTW